MCARDFEARDTKDMNAASRDAKTQEIVCAQEERTILSICSSQTEPKAHLIPRKTTKEKHEKKKARMRESGTAEQHHAETHALTRIR